MYCLIDKSVSFIIDAVCNIHDIPPKLTNPTAKIIFNDEDRFE